MPDADARKRAPVRVSVGHDGRRRCFLDPFATANLADAFAACEARVEALTDAIALALEGLPDPMHPRFDARASDRLAAAQVVLLSAIGHDDPGNVEACRAILSASHEEKKR